jgi:crossover junction endodeoxyribonuclease RuvC
VSSGCIRTPQGATLAERIKVIVEHLFQVIDTYQPQEAAVEQVFVNVNPAATLMLGQARGAAISVLVQRALPVAEYTALQVKQSVVGHGKAPKEQVQAMVVRMLSLSGTPQADAADALAVALAHANHSHKALAAFTRGGLRIKGGRLA